MVDFHSHILPNVDDGVTNIDDTIKLLKEAKEVGFSKIISTSHYIQGYYDIEHFERKQIIKEINLEHNSHLPKLYIGNEIYITPEIVDLLKNQKASTINDSKYILIELPKREKPLFAKEIIYDLIGNGYIPIIAHPERYEYVKEDIKYIKELKEMGALFQANYGSVVGMYGNGAKRTLKDLLKNNLISFLGSDVHNCGQIYPQIPKIIKKLSKVISNDDLELLTTLNAENVLKNKEIE